MLVDDGVDGADYLIGLGEQAEILVVYVDPDSGWPTKYAVLPSTLDFADGDSTEADLEYGAAYTYVHVEDGAYAVELLFSSNQGFGVFELSLPLVVPAACWNEGTDTSGHFFCDAAEPVALTRVAPSDKTSSNDGMNCPYPAEPAPTPAPAVSACVDSESW